MILNARFALINTAGTGATYNPSIIIDERVRRERRVAGGGGQGDPLTLLLFHGAGCCTFSIVLFSRMCMLESAEKIPCMVYIYM